MAKDKLKFYDLSKKKSFTTSDYKFVNKKGRKFAVATCPGTKKETWRIVSSKKK